ncbi:MAG TPA: type II toxin-antitoxin system VapC family toxin, partial [Bacilli bacterium]
MAKVYLETTIPSYLSARISRDIVVAAQQQITGDWLDDSASQYDLFISEAVLDECRAGDAIAAVKRLESIEHIPVLKISEDVVNLAFIYHKLLDIPDKAKVDAIHLAAAVSYEMDYLLTWNCKHLAHGEIRMKLHHYNAENGLHEPMIVTP